MSFSDDDRAAQRRIDKQFDSVRRLRDPIPRGERYKHGVEKLARGGYVRLRGRVYEVVDMSDYREKGGRWHELELFCVNDGRTSYLEWEKDDEIEISFNQPALTLKQIGLSADQIEDMSERESGTITFDGRSFQYDDDYGATFHRGGRSEGEPVYFYDFETRDEKWCLTVEEWGDANRGFEYEVFVSEYIEEDMIEVLAPGASG